jgi:hydrogenase-4 membrane subunit HyfE
MLRVLIALFVLYALLVTWQMRRALSSEDPTERSREAVLLLLLVSAGVPLAGLLIFAAL